MTAALDHLLLEDVLEFSIVMLKIQKKGTKI